jgi:hypothetical protein
MIVEQILAYDATTGRELLDTLRQRSVSHKPFAHAGELKERHEFLEGWKEEVVYWK